MSTCATSGDDANAAAAARRAALRNFAVPQVMLAGGALCRDAAWPPLAAKKRRLGQHTRTPLSRKARQRLAVKGMH